MQLASMLEDIHLWALLQHFVRNWQVMWSWVRNLRRSSTLHSIHCFSCWLDNLVGLNFLLLHLGQNWGMPIEELGVLLINRGRLWLLKFDSIHLALWLLFHLTLWSLLWNRERFWIHYDHRKFLISLFCLLLLLRRWLTIIYKVGQIYLNFRYEALS